MANPTPTVNFIGYNSTGIDKHKCAWIRDLCSLTEASFISIQEHFKIAKTTDKYFSEEFSEFYSYVIPGHRPKGQDSGRPKAGIAQLSRKNIEVRKDRIVTKHFRLQAQILNFSNTRLLWINSYFPTDSQNVVFDETELSEVLAEVEKIMDTTVYDDILWQGDLNWDMSRNSGFSVMLKRFFSRLGLVSLWEKHQIDYTHVHTDFKTTSTLDHFIMNERLLSLVVDCGPLHLGDNRSRHSPVMVKLNLGAIPVKQVQLKKTLRKPAWYKANKEHIDSYNKDVENRLNSVHIPDSCKCVDLKCTDSEHSSERDSLVLDILVNMIEASHYNIPIVGGKTVKSGVNCQSSSIPGWQEQVLPFQEDARFWYSVWRSAGRPDHGALHDIMARTRNRYHYSVRRARKNAHYVRAKKIFEASEAGNIDLLQEMKRIRNGGARVSPDLPDNVAGANGVEEIVNKFREVYSKLYNSWGSEKQMVDVKKRVSELIDSENSVQEVFKLTGQVVKKAVLKMKPSKADVSEGFTSDSLLHAPDSLFNLLALVYRSWLIHGTVTPSLLACAFLPLLKSSLKDPADTNSYRAIAGSSLLLKLFDQCVLLLWGHLLASDSLQFGYKQVSGTTQCSWMVMEVANHFMRNGTSPIVTLLDCSKAFDMVRYDILFRKLLDKGLPAVVVQVIIVVYERQYAWVRWDKGRSNMFSIVNGTRQGSVLSPALFSLYMDEILETLRSLGVGCYVGEVFMGAMGYADDLVLIAPSRTAMQMMLQACEDFGSRNNLLFSTDPDPSKSKTKCLFMSGKKRQHRPAPLSLYGRDLPFVSTATHLGNVLSQDGSMETDVREKTAGFITRSLLVREQFSFAHPMEVLRAVRVYCCDHYGSMLWDMQGDPVKKYFNSWKICIKLAWGVPRATHSYFLDYLSGGLITVRRDIIARYVNFYRSLLASPCREVNILSRVVAKDIRSTTARNLQLVERESAGLTWAAPPSKVKEALAKGEPAVPEADAWRIGYLGNLLEKRDMLVYQGEEESEEVGRTQELINSLCTN